MSQYYTKEERFVATLLVGIALSIPIWLCTPSFAEQARHRAEVRLAAETGLAHWWHRGDPDNAARSTYATAFLFTVLAFGFSHVFAPVSLAAKDAINDAKRQKAARKEREQMQESVRRMDAESERQARNMNVAQSKQEIITRLGTIDQYIRAYRGEQSESRQLVALQAAQSESTALSGKLASREIDAEAMTDAHVIACARETIAELVGAGLGQDRICRELRRMFKNPVAG